MFSCVRPNLSVRTDNAYYYVFIVFVNNVKLYIHNFNNYYAAVIHSLFRGIVFNILNFMKSKNYHNTSQLDNSVTINKTQKPPYKSEPY